MCLSRALSSDEGKHLCNFGIGHQEEHFCEIILYLDQLLRRCCLKTFLIYSSYGPKVQHIGTICAILVEGIMSNISVKLPAVQEMAF